MIYLAEVSEGIKLTLAMVGAIALTILVVVSVMLCVEDEWDKYGGKVKRAITLSFVAIAVSIFIPSSKTIYMIAGSEIGEEALASERGRKIIDILDQKIDEIAKDQPHE